MGVPRTAKYYAPATNATGIVDDTIVNADVNSAAAIAFSKLAALASGKILVGSAGNVATAVTPSGHMAITNAGVVSVLGGAAAAASDFTVTAVATKDIKMKLGDAAGVSAFHVLDSADQALFTVDSTGVMTLEGGTTIDNSAAANTVTITETNIALVGAVTVTGSIDLPANTVVQADVQDDAVGMAELKYKEVSVTVANGQASGTTTDATCINGQIIGIYPASGAEKELASVALTSGTGAITVTESAAQGAGDAVWKVVVLQV